MNIKEIFDTRIKSSKVLMTPQQIEDLLPLNEESAQTQLKIFLMGKINVHLLL
jgi:hypothetical protein